MTLTHGRGVTNCFTADWGGHLEVGGQGGDQRPLGEGMWRKTETWLDGRAGM